MEQLPEDLSTLDEDELDAAADARDKRVTRLMRRWPKLNRIESRELRHVYGERLRLARYFGRMRRR
jgi:hypothetical protein